MRLMLALAWAGFRRYATYRQATAAATATNTVFGCLRTYVLLATAAAAGGAVAGYSSSQLVTYVWVGQGLLGVVALWGWTDLSDRIRTGDVVSDLLRPVNPVWTYLATDMGRATHAATVRMLVPVAFGAVFFPFYWPGNPVSYPLFAVSLVLAVVLCFALRYMVNATAFWLLDPRGANMLWAICSGVGSGLYFPIGFLPDWLAALLQYGTPLPSIIQFPADVLVERGAVGGQLARIAVQAAWAVACLAAAVAVQRAATRRLVIQGG